MESRKLLPSLASTVVSTLSGIVAIDFCCHFSLFVFKTRGENVCMLIQARCRVALV